MSDEATLNDLIENIRSNTLKTLQEIEIAPHSNDGSDDCYSDEPKGETPSSGMSLKSEHVKGPSNVPKAKHVQQISEKKLKKKISKKARKLKEKIEAKKREIIALESIVPETKAARTEDLPPLREVPPALPQKKCPKKEKKVSNNQKNTKPGSNSSQGSSSAAIGPKDGTATKPNVLNPKQPQPTAAVDQFLISLLTLSPKERDTYIIKLSKERGLLETNLGGRSGLVFLKRSSDILETAQALRASALSFCYGIRKPAIRQDVLKPFQTVTALIKTVEKKEKLRRTFEDEVSYLLNNGKITEKQNYNPELTLTNVSKAERNGFLHEENRAALNALVERLVASGVGYIVEGVLRISANNNAFAFVDDHTSEADVCITTVLLRKCAMDGDYVKVFVKYSKDTDEQRTEEEEEESEGRNEEPTTLALTSGSEETAASELESGTDTDVVPAPAARVKNNLGFVVDILERRHSRLCVGTFTYFNDTKALQYIKFAPRDTRIPHMKVFRQHWPEALFQNDFQELASVIYQAEVLEWHDDVPVGSIIKSIGKCGDLEAESKAILVEYDLDVTPYADEILAGLPAVPFVIPEEEIARREDMREECVFTIDPLTARDLDDALSCKLLKNGNFEIGVHISDVSYFLHEGSDLDELVKLKATSIYMVDGVYHMLPQPLCFLCSLLPGEDKLAFSVFWEITPGANIVNTRFAKTVINSCAQLAYEHAQTMLDNPNADLRAEDFPPILNGYSANFLSRIVNQLQAIAVQLRARRIANGCLKINQPKLTFKLDPSNGTPVEYMVYELRPANQLIEDFMLLANQSVASFTHSKFPDISVLRKHAPPADNQLKNLVALLAKHGYQLRTESSASLAKSMQDLIASNPAAEPVLNIMLSKPMMRARYFCAKYAIDESDFRHYALAIPIYTHFTSPIRRYADCLVHRVLAAALDLCKPPSRTPEELNILTGICNVKKYNAKLAGDESALLYFRHYLARVKSFVTDAAVSEITPMHLEVVLVTTGHVVKTGYKQLSSMAEFKLIEDARPIRSCLLIPKDKTLKPFNLQLFTKLRVVVQLSKHNTLTIASIVLPGQQEVAQPKATKDKVTKTETKVGTKMDTSDDTT